MAKLSWVVHNFFSNRRDNKIRKIVNQNKLYKIVMKSNDPGWQIAIERINDPVIAEKILRSDSIQKHFSLGGSYFHVTTKLIDILDNDVVAQELYTNEIEVEIDRIKADYKKNDRVIRDEMGFGITQRNMLNRIERVVSYIDKIRDTDNQKSFLVEVAAICENAPMNVLGYKSNYASPHPTKEFGKELQKKITAAGSPSPCN